VLESPFPPQVYEPSKVARDQGIQYFDSIGFNNELFSPVGTDAFNFNLARIPASGVLTGQDCCKTQGDVDLFGGSLGNFEGNVPSFDGGCVDNPFRWCDNLSNNDQNVLTFMSKGFANMVVGMAFDTLVVAGHHGKPNLAAVSEARPRHQISRSATASTSSAGRYGLARKRSAPAASAVSRSVASTLALAMITLTAL
jgi:hypothetical protein